MNHTIVAMVGEKIVRVECNTCHGIHNYHPIKAPKEPVAPKAATQKKEAAPRKAKVDPAAVAAAQWATVMSAKDPAQAVPYDMNGTYRLNNLLLHPVFGLGIVQIVLPNKIEVLFENGVKRLRCG
jgi:hypothetical protein